MKRVFVSGGSGYIAMYCIKILISKGYYVVTSVIDKSKIDVVKNALINHGVSCDNIDFKILNLLNDEGWDDAVTLALTYAEVDYETLWDTEVHLGKLNDYDWLHLHHEDFTGQHGKFYRSHRNSNWYKQQ